MDNLLILHTAASRNTQHIMASEAVLNRFAVTAINYADVTGFDGGTLKTNSGAAIDLRVVHTIWLDFDWELHDSHINYFHITRLLVGAYADKLAINRVTFQKYHPVYDDKLFVADVLHHAGLPHPATSLLSDAQTFTAGLTVVKKRFSGRARDVYLVSSPSELEPVVRHAARDYICQAYIDIVRELRVVVYRDQIVAAIDKSSKFKGGQIGKVKILGSQYELDETQQRICIDTARVIESELVGIDLAVDSSGKSWIIEFNIGADLAGFKKVTGIDLLTDTLLTR